jgi:hypothetical protein
MAAPVLLLIAPPVLLQRADPLRQRIGEDTFRQSGLDQLSPTQLHTLERLLAAHASELADAAPVSAAASATAVSRSTRSKATVESRLVGTFRGWRRGSMLTLANGQRWKISDDSSLFPGNPIEQPAVTVKRGLLGGWLHQGCSD